MITNKKLSKLEKEQLAFSKKLINDIRGLLWIVTIGGFVLAFVCIWRDYTASIPWITSMVGLPWAAHATVCSFYMNKSKAENTSMGVTYEYMMAQMGLGSNTTNNNYTEQNNDLGRVDDDATI